MTRNIPFLKLCVTTLICGLFCNSVLFADDLSVRGRVNTILGDPAPNLLVRIVGTSDSAVTDEDGAFHVQGNSTGIDGPARIRKNLGSYELPSTVIASGFDGSRAQGTLSLLGRRFPETLSSQFPAMAIVIEVPKKSPHSTSLRSLAMSRAVIDTLQVCKGNAVLAEVPLETLNTDVGVVALETGIPHPLLVASYSKKKAFIIDESNQVVWEYRMPGSCQDAWMLSDSTILLSGGGSVRIVNRNKDILWEYKNESTEIHNCQPLPNGGVLFGVNATGMVYEIAPDSTILKKLDLSFISGNSHGRFRMIRKSGDRYVVCAKAENTIYIIDADGTVERKITKEDMQEKGIQWNALHAAILLPNGNLLVGGGYNSTICEIDESGEVVWNLTDDDVPTIGLKYAAGFHRLPNGNTVVSAYNSTNYKIFEVTPEKEIAWSMDNDDMGNPTHVYALDCPGDPANGLVLR